MQTPIEVDDGPLSIAQPFLNVSEPGLRGIAIERVAARIHRPEHVRPVL